MILAALILPGIALAQQAQGSHTVVDGYTSIRDAVFEQGVVVRLTKKMR